MAKADISRWKNLAVFILMTCCTLENTLDKALTPMFFKSYENLGYSSSQLGYLSMIQMGTFFMALPLWSVLLTKYTFRDLLIASSFTWGCGTFLLGMTTDYTLQCMFRIPTGIALAATVPISQSVYSELCDVKDLGKVFGVSNLIVHALTACKFYFGYSYSQYWLDMFRITGSGGILFAVVLYFLFPNTYRSSRKTTSLQVVKDIVRMTKLPVMKQFFLQAFLNGVGFQAITFLGLWWQNSGFTSQETGFVMCVNNLAIALGTLLGGYLGDFAVKHTKQGSLGRVTVAQYSLCGRCIPFMMLFAVSVRGNYYKTIVINAIFAVISSWVAVCATRPMVSEMFTEPAERGQAMAVIRIFTTIGSFVGAPAVGSVSGFFGYTPSKRNGNASPIDRSANDVLGFVILTVAVCVWITSSLLWLSVHKTYPIALAAAKAKKEKSQ